MNKKNIVLEVGVKAFIKNSQNQYLILQRANPYPKEKICKWDIPGGRINPGEVTPKALGRELKEETNLVLKKIHKILAVQDINRVENIHTVRLTYIAECTGKVRINNKEHQNYKWLKLEEIKKMKKDKYLTPLLDLLLE